MNLGAVITPTQHNGAVHALKVQQPHRFGAVETSMDGRLDPAKNAEMLQLSEALSDNSADSLRTVG